MFEANSLCDKLLFVANVVTDNIRNKCAPLRAASPHHTQYIFLKKKVKQIFLKTPRLMVLPIGSSASE